MRRALTGFVAAWLFAVQALAGDVHVMSSGAFTAALKELAPQFQKASGHKVQMAFGASMGNAPDSIPSRLDRSEPADLVILAADALEALAQRGKVLHREAREHAGGQQQRAVTLKPAEKTTEHVPPDSKGEGSMSCFCTGTCKALGDGL